MHTRSWKSHLGAVTIVVALVIVANPELRALLLLADVLGLEALALLVATQLRFYWPVFRVVAEPVLVATCGMAFAFGRGALRAVSMIMPIGPFTVSLCIALPVLSRNLRCPLHNRPP